MQNKKPAFSQGVAVPAFKRDQLATMSNEDKQAIVNSLIDNFQLVTSLSEEEVPLAKKMLQRSNYDLDKAIVYYYEYKYKYNF